MTSAIASIITASTLAKLVVGALVAGLGVTVAFSLLIYCADRATEARRGSQTTAARLFLAGSALALAACLAIVAYGLILTTTKPK